MGWIELESFGLLRPEPADELVGREAAKGLEPLGEVVGVHEVAEMGSELRKRRKRRPEALVAAA